MKNKSLNFYCWAANPRPSLDELCGKFSKKEGALRHALLNSDANHIHVFRANLEKVDSRKLGWIKK